MDKKLRSIDIIKGIGIIMIIITHNRHFIMQDMSAVSYTHLTLPTKLEV